MKLHQNSNILPLMNLFLEYLFVFVLERQLMTDY